MVVLTTIVVLFTFLMNKPYCTTADNTGTGRSFTIKIPDGVNPVFDFSLQLYHHQSPVNLDLNKAQEIYVEKSPLKIKAKQSNDYKYIVRNSGHGVEVVIDEKELQKVGEDIRPTIFGGILPNTSPYVFQNVHYHWGSTDALGSEHQINGKWYSFEGHMVTFKKEYGTFEEAVKKKDGVVVFTILAQVGENNDALDQFLKYVPLVKEYGGNGETLVGTDALLWFLPQVEKLNRDYIVYPGSLTTPTYDETVTFLIAPTPLTISRRQLEVFRGVLNKEGEKLTSNRRELQTQPYPEFPIAYVKDNLKIDYGKYSSPSENNFSLLRPLGTIITPIMTPITSLLSSRPLTSALTSAR